MDTKTATTTKTAEIIQRLYAEAMNGENLDVVDELVAEDLVDHGALPEQKPGREGFKERIRMFREGFPDQTLTVEDMVTDDDRAALRVTSRGTHTGRIFGLHPTGRGFEIQGMDFYRLEDGVIVEHWAQYDTQSLMRQLGLS